MIIDYTSIILIVFFLLLGWVALFIHHTMKKEQEFQEKERETFIRYQKILKQGHDEARKIVTNATEESAQLLQESRVTNEHITENLDHVMQEVAKEQLAEVKHETETFKTNYEKKLHAVEDQFSKNTDEVVANTEKNVQHALDQFTQSLIEKAASSEEIIDNKTKELLQQVEIEVDQYKRGRLRKLDEEIAKLIQTTYTDVMHRTMPESVHHELIIESLEKAKKDGVFSV